MQASIFTKQVSIPDSIGEFEVDGGECARRPQHPVYRRKSKIAIRRSIIVLPRVSRARARFEARSVPREVEKAKCGGALKLQGARQIEK